MVFASINQDAFADLYDESLAESTMASSSSMMSDQLPPFTVMINAVNEKGGAAIHVIQGITLVNYGTTYSIDDLYTETTYSYVATDVFPMMATTLSLARAKIEEVINKTAYPTISSGMKGRLGKDYGTNETNVAYGLKVNRSSSFPNLGLD